ncbi:MAG TPA: flagellar hook protein FlgE [Bryobacteraceae bacterium]|nr:flagellar hook protein FlgE [Bryobacteraceae bacterium]
MFTAFSAALTGLSANEVGIDAVGNNLANLNTTGYKAETVNFYDLVAQSLGLGNGQTSVGLGTGKPTVVQGFTQGAIQSTNGALDAAIQGDGFFVVQDPSSGAIQYSRAGNFQVDANGDLVTATGQNVQGWTAVAGVLNTNGSISDIRIPSGTLQAPVATQNLSMDLNLNAAVTTGSPDATFSTPINVYDSLGNVHTLTVTFTQTAANTWSYAVSIPGADVTGGTAGTPFPIAGATGTLNFDSNGNLTTPAATDPPVAIAVTGLTDGASDLNINWSLYNPDGTSMITQYASQTEVSSNTQDGTAAAQLTHVALSNGGEVVAQFSDGQQVTVGQLALASIRNPESLTAVGDNNFQVSSQTSIPAIGVPNTGGRGQVLAGALESSTVDIAQEFTSMISYQSGYQAASKVITTADTLTQTVINLIQG